MLQFDSLMQVKDISKDITYLQRLYILTFQNVM